MLANGNVAWLDDVIFYLTTAQFATIGTEVVIHKFNFINDVSVNGTLAFGRN
jgi:hypothetical protein